MKGTPKTGAGSSDEGAAAKHRHYQKRTGERRPMKEMVSKGNNSRKKGKTYQRRARRRRGSGFCDPRSLDDFRGHGE